MKILIKETQFFSLLNVINEENKENSKVFYHGATDKKLKGKTGIHIGTKMSAKQALEAKLGVPAEGEWDGTRIYGDTLLAGKKTLKKLLKILDYDPIIGFNAMDDVPEEDYYPKDRKHRARYFSTNTLIPLNVKPLIFKVKIVGNMKNTYDTPYKDLVANGLISRQLKQKNAKNGYFYINEYEDKGSISAVVPDKSYLKIVS